MATIKFKLIPDKTEYILFGSKRRRERLKACFPIAILGSPRCKAGLVKKLGLWFNSDLSMSKYVPSVCGNSGGGG